MSHSSLSAINGALGRAYPARINSHSRPSSRPALDQAKPKASHTPFSTTADGHGWWVRILEQITTAFRPYIPALSVAGAPVPQVEFYQEQIADDAFAELAWPQLHPPVAVLAAIRLRSPASGNSSGGE